MNLCLKDKKLSESKCADYTHITSMYNRVAERTHLLKLFRQLPISIDINLKQKRILSSARTHAKGDFTMENTSYHSI